MYNNPEVQQLIRSRARDGLIIYSDHGTDQADSREVDDEEIRKCLLNGILIGEDWNAEYQDTTYQMARGANLSSRLVVVVALTETHDIVVTTFRKERK